MLRSLVLIPMLTAGLAVPAMAQQKAEIPKEGKYEYTNCYSGTANSLQFSKTDNADSFEIAGANRSNPPGGFLDMTTNRCIGLVSTVDGKQSGIITCELFDKDGSTLFSRFNITGPKTVVDTNVGTGKFEGITRTAVVEPIGTFPVAKPGTFQGCSRVTGTYKLRSEATGTSTPSK